MTHREKLAELEKELARQDSDLAAVMSRLEDMPAIPVEVAKQFMREAEEACAVEIDPQPLVFGIRG